MAFIRLAVLFLVIVFVAGCTGAKSIEGYVVDAETGEPVQDVIVVVAWRVITGLHGQTKGFLVLDEAVTDKNGYYFLPSWEGKYVGFFAALDNKSPELNYFKYGYELKYQSNMTEYARTAPVKSPRESVWNGKKVEFQFYHGDDAGRFQTLSTLSHYYTARPGCISARLPILSQEIRRLNALAKMLPSVNSTRLPTLDHRNEIECLYGD